MTTSPDTAPADVPPLRWGVLGTGGIARSFTADLANLPGASAVAVGSRSQESADAFGEANGVARRHASYAALVEDDDVDAVYVATPHPWHAEHALLALAAGKPVLVEKPFTMDAAQARQVRDAARAAGLFCMEAMWTRFLPHMVRLRELLDEGAVGDVRTVAADHGQDFGGAAVTHRLLAPELGGGALLDLGIYPVSFAHWVLGRPDTVTAVDDPAVTGVDAQTTAVLHRTDGAHGLVTCTLSAATACVAQVSGTQGRITVERTWYAPSRLVLERRDGRTEEVDGRAARLTGPDGQPGKGLRFEAAEVARCLADGRTESEVMPMDETVSVMEVLDAIRASAASGARVVLP